MGAFFTNYQVRSDSPEAVGDALRELVPSAAYVSPAAGGWVTVYDESSEDQDLDRLRQVAAHLSKMLSSLVMALLVHDSDVLVYLLYRDGQIIDEFSSAPGYPAVSGMDPQRWRGKADVLLPLCKPATPRGAIAAVLDLSDSFVLAEQIAEELAELLGIERERATLGYNGFIEGEHSLDDAERFVGIGPTAKPVARRQPMPEPMPEPMPPADEEPFPGAVIMLASSRRRPGSLLEGLGGMEAKVFRRQIAHMRRSMDRVARDLFERSPLRGSLSFEQLSATADEGMGPLATLVASVAPHLVQVIAEQSARNGLGELLRELLAQGASTEMPGAGGATLLCLAAIASDPGGVTALLDHGADPNARDASGYTPLMHAASIGATSLPVVQALLARGADVHARAPDGHSPLSLARRHANSGRQLLDALDTAARRGD